jgi:hypothetical protein
MQIVGGGYAVIVVPAGREFLIQGPVFGSGNHCPAPMVASKQR